MNKHAILRALDDAPDEVKGLTVKELMTKLRAEVAQEKSFQEELEEALCEKFKDKYIKTINPNSMFGKETLYIHIKDIRPGSITTEYKRLFDIKGTKVCFSAGLCNIREMKMRDIYDSMDEKELNSAEVISKEDYEYSINKIGEIDSIAKEMNP